MTEGWICPVCKAGVSPLISKCPCATTRLQVQPWKPQPAPQPPYTVTSDTWPEVRYLTPSSEHPPA